MDMDLYKKALKNHYRFSFKGNLSVEDLFSLSLEELDSLYCTLLKAQESCTKSLLKEKSKKDIILIDSIEIVKDIIFDRQRDIEEASKAQMVKEYKKQIEEIIADKEHENLKSKSIEELKALLGTSNPFTDES